MYLCGKKELVPNWFFDHLQSFLAKPFFDQVPKKGSALVKFINLSTRGECIEFGQYLPIKIKLFLSLSYVFFFHFNVHFWTVRGGSIQKKLTNQKSLCEFVSSSHTYWKTLRFRRRTSVSNVVVSLSIRNILFSSVDWERKSFEKLSFLPQFEKKNTDCFDIFTSCLAARSVPAN